MINYNLVIDQSTSGTKVLLVSDMIIDRVDKKHEQIYPKIGWVEHDALEIIDNIKYLIDLILERNNLLPSQIDAISITNQRETIVSWNKATGVPFYNALVWQCNRAQSICDELQNNGQEKIVREKTGLNIDTYFSGPKLKWLSQNCENYRKALETSNVCIGTIDSWVIWNLTNGIEFKTDMSNASRTMLFNINDLKWDDELLAMFDVKLESLPKIEGSDSKFGSYMGIPIIGVIADSQASLIANDCDEVGHAKITLGTGSSIMLNSKYEKDGIHPTLVHTIACKKEDKVTYAIEGVIRSMGDTLQWAKNELCLIDRVDMDLQGSFEANGVIFIPAQLGMGTPYWTTKSKASINGLTRNSSRTEIIRSIYASLIFQIKDVIDEINNYSNSKVLVLKVDGGLSKNEFLMKSLSDLLQITIYVSDTEELSAIGALKLARRKLNINYLEYKPSKNKKLLRQYDEWKQYVVTHLKMEENYVKRKN